MLNLYERLGGKDLQREAPEKKKPDGSQEEKSKHKKNSVTDGQGEPSPSPDMSGGQDSQIPNAPEQITPDTAEASQPPSQETAKGEGKKKISFLKKLIKRKKDQSKRVRFADPEASTLRTAPQTSMSRPTENRASGAHYNDTSFSDDEFDDNHNFSQQSSLLDLAYPQFSSNQQYYGPPLNNPYSFNSWQSPYPRLRR